MPGILDLFVPREKKFFELLKDLSGRTHDGAKLFLAFVSDYDQLKVVKKRAVVEELKNVELDCDAITHNIAIELNKTFLTPIDREDIHRLSTLLDDVMDIIYNMGHKLVLYNMNKLPKFMLELTKVAFECSGEVDLLISRLDEMRKTDAYIKRIHELEKQADALRNESLAYLFNDSLSAIDIIKFKDIYEQLETICDKAEDIADVVEGIVIKYS